MRVFGPPRVRWSAPLARAVWTATALAVSGLWVQAFMPGVPPLFHICHVASQCSSYQLNQSAARLLADHHIPVALYAGFSVAVTICAWLVWFGIGGLIVWRRPLDLGAYVSVLFLAVFPLLFASFWVDSASESSAIADLAVLSLFPFLLLFPSGRFVPRWSWALLATVLTLVIWNHLPHTHHPAEGLLIAPAMLSAIAAQIYRFRSVSSWSERRQTKWAILGVSVAVVSLLASLLVIKTGDIPTSSLYSDFVDVIVAVVTSAIPISLGLALLRSGLWDVDRVISRALAYALLTAVVVGAYVGGVIGLQALFALFVRDGSPAAVALSTLAIVAIFGSLRKRIQAAVDRRFYRSGYDAVHMLAVFSERVRDQVDIERLARDLAEAVRETVHPEHVSLWLCDRLHAPFAGRPEQS